MFSKMAVALTLLSIISCIRSTGNKESIPIDRSKITGQWIVVDALRNNRPTQTINGAIFSIKEDHVIHNLNGLDSTYQIEWKDSAFIASDRTEYRVQSIYDSLLILQFNMLNHKFKLSMNRYHDVIDSTEYK